MDSPSALPSCFPAAAFGKPTGPDQKKILCKYLCNCQCKKKKIVHAIDFDFHNGYQLQICDYRIRVYIYKQKLEGNEKELKTSSF